MLLRPRDVACDDEQAARIVHETKARKEGRWVAVQVVKSAKFGEESGGRGRDKRKEEEEEKDGK